MPLTDFTEIFENFNGTTYTAKGSKGEAVTIEASHDVIRDRGSIRVQQKASDKYDGGGLMAGKVTVRTLDFGSR